MLRLALASVALLTACSKPPAAAPAGEGSAPPPAPEPVPAGSASGEPAASEGSAPAVGPATIRITPDAVRVAVGDPLVEMSAQVFDAEGNVLDVPVAWHSLDPARVRVSPRGVLTPLGPLGPAFITASAGDVVAEQVPVYVTAPALPEPDGSDGSEDAGPRVRRLGPRPAAR